MYPTHTKIINSTVGDDQFDSDIIFDSPNGNVNSGSIEKDTHVHDLCALEQLARNAYQEAEKQQIFAQKVQKQNTTLTSHLELYKERVRVLKNINGDNNYLNEFLEADKQAKHFSQQAKSQFVRDRDIIRDLEKQRDKLDLDISTVLDLEAKLKKNVDLILKHGNSLQGMFMLGPKPLSVYDQQLKHGNSEISLNVRDTEDTLDDASKSQQKVYEKMNDPIAIANKQNCWTIDYTKINALYKDFVPQKELSAEQKYFPSSFIPSDKNSNATPSIPASMPNQLKPIVNELQFYFEFFKTLFQRDIKEMKDVFESTESELCELEKQNYFLKDQLLEVSLKHEVELSVLLNHECVDNSLHAEIEQLKKKSIEIQEGLQTRIKILEKDVQRCEKQSVDFELKLQHEKEKHKWDSNLKNKNTNPLDYSWISKMEKLEDENVSLDFTVQSLIKERDNVKLEYQKLFNSIKKTRSQTQTEMDELIAHVSEKTYAYGAIRAENQNLLFTISELKTRLANVEKGKSVNTKFDKTNGSQPLLCVTPLHKHVIQKKTDVQKSKENHVVSKPVTLQTSPAKQSGVNSNKNVIAPGMYKVVTTHESQTNEAKHDLSSTGMNAASSVRRPMNRDSHVKNSVLANSKKPAKKVAVYVRKNKQTDNTSENVISNKENVIDVDIANASKAKTLLCIVQIVLWIVDSGCSKHMTGDQSLLKNFIKKFMGTVRFENDNFAAITGFGDYIQGNITICHVHYVEGLGHNLFSVGQFCDGDLEVAFRSKTCYAAFHTFVYMSKATSKQSLVYGTQTLKFNFGTINDLPELDLVDGLLKFKYEKDHLCSVCERGKSKKASHPLKLIPSDHSKLELLHMDLCGPIRVASMNGKKYILVIVDDYSRYTWVYFLHSKDETLEIIKKFIAQARLNYKAKVCKIQPELQRFNNHNSSAETMNTPSKEDLDNLLGPMFEEYFKKKFSDTTINFAAQPTQFHEDSPSTSSIIIDEHEAPPIVTTSDEQTSLISLTEADEFNQEDSADFDGNSQFVLYNPPSHEEIESSTTALEPSNV
ncbi:integrase, catalytic region, zinc finger, CCHC-type containing protein [Tanacetum coccineum]